MAARKKLPSEIRGAIGNLVLHVDDWFERINAIMNAHQKLTEGLYSKDNCKYAIQYYEAIKEADKFIDNLLSELTKPIEKYKGSYVKAISEKERDRLNEWRDYVFEAKKNWKECLNENPELKKMILEERPDLNKEFIDKLKKKVQHIEEKAGSQDQNQEVKSDIRKPS